MTGVLLMDNAGAHIDFRSVQCMTYSSRRSRRSTCVLTHKLGGRNISRRAARLFDDEPGYPGSSPDFNPCELIISQIKHNAYIQFDREGHKSPGQLMTCVQRATHAVTLETIEKCYSHCYRAMIECVEEKGGYGKCVGRSCKKREDIFTFD